MTHAVGLSGWLDGALEPQPLMLHATRLLAMGLLDALLDVAARWCT